MTMTKTPVTSLNKEVAIKNILAGVATDKYNNYKALTYVSAIEIVKQRDPGYEPVDCWDHYYEVEAKFRGRKVNMKISITKDRAHVWWGKYSSPVRFLPGLKDWSSEIEKLRG